ncbi:MAG: sensor histidine kinase [bacterium]
MSCSILDPTHPANFLSDLQALDPAAFANHLTDWLSGDNPAGLPLNIWRHSAASGVDESLLKLWRAGVYLARAIERTALEFAVSLPQPGMTLAYMLQASLWTMAAQSPEKFHEWLTADSASLRQTLETNLLGARASIWSQMYLQKNGQEELARFLWTSRDLASLPGGNSQGSSEKTLSDVLVSALKLYHQSRYNLAKASRPMASLKDPKVSLIELQVEQETKPEAFFAPADDRLVRLVTHSIHQHLRLELQQRWMKSATLILTDMCLSADQVAANAHSTYPDTQQRFESGTGDTLTLARLQQAESRWASLKSFWWKMMDRFDDWADSVSHEHHISESQAQAMRFESLAEFAAGAGHELNNPLAVIQGRAQQLLAKSQDASSRQALKAIIDQTSRAHRMLRDLIFIARPGRSNPGLFRPADIVRGVVRELRDEADRRQVTLEMLPNRLGRMETDQLDPDGFRQILLGLARNAIEASPPDSCVQVDLVHEVGTIKIQVADQGRGFSSTDAAHLFDPFYCGRKAGRGLGLGLPRMARVVSQMNGRIRYRSNPGGKGSTFEVILPLPEEHRSQSFSHSA